MLIEPTPLGLYCAAGGFHIDPWAPVDRAVITHAHGDHLRPGSRGYLCASASSEIVRRRLPADAAVSSAPYGETVTLDGVRVSFHPAGHVLGSSQVRVERGGEVWVASGDFKLAADPTCAPFEPVRCHAFISEATFGLPIFRWQPTDIVIDEVLTWWDEMRQAGRPAVLFAYALGKAQRVLAELVRRTDRPVFVHGALVDLIETYRAAGVTLAPTRVATDEPRGTSFAGDAESARGAMSTHLARSHDRFTASWTADGAAATKSARRAGARETA